MMKNPPTAAARARPVTTSATAPARRGLTVAAISGSASDVSALMARATGISRRSLARPSATDTGCIAPWEARDPSVASGIDFGVSSRRPLPFLCFFPRFDSEDRSGAAREPADSVASGIVSG